MSLPETSTGTLSPSASPTGTASSAPSLTSLQIHRFCGLQPGPRLIVTGAVHGNETAGTRGIQQVLGELASGALQIVRGSVTFVPICNPLAYQRGQRMGDRNLNRRLQPTATPQDYEDRLANVLCPLLAQHQVLLDLHSFRNPGQPFVLRGPANNRDALEPFAHEQAEAQLAAHVGVNRIVEGWMSAYAGGVARRRARAQEQMSLGYFAHPPRGAAATPPGGALLPGSLHEDPSYGVGTTEYMRSQGGYGVTLECGQHDDPAGPAVAHHAIHQTLALLGLTDAPLRAPTQPFECLTLAEVVDRHADGDQFVKRWMSFDALAEGELIAVREDGSEVRAPQAGRIVFPDLNATPGHEWFYLAKPSSRPLQVPL
jgi:succinylglutamate desuccinylase